MTGAGSIEEITPLGTSSEEHVAAVKSILSGLAADCDQDVQMDPQNADEHEQEDAARQ